MPLRRIRRLGVVQDFDSVAVKDGDDGAGEVSGKNRNVSQYQAAPHINFSQLSYSDQILIPQGHSIEPQLGHQVFPDASL